MHARYTMAMHIMGMSEMCLELRVDRAQLNSNITENQINTTLHTCVNVCVYECLCRLLHVLFNSIGMKRKLPRQTNYYACTDEHQISYMYSNMHTQKWKDNSHRMRCFHAGNRFSYTYLSYPIDIFSLMSASDINLIEV